MPIAFLLWTSTFVYIYIYIYIISVPQLFYLFILSFDDSFFRLESNKLLWFVLYMVIAVYGFLIWPKKKKSGLGSAKKQKIKRTTLES